MKTEYEILVSDALSGLEAEVNVSLQLGWKLQGGVSAVEVDRIGTRYLQAVYREVE